VVALAGYWICLSQLATFPKVSHPYRSADANHGLHCCTGRRGGRLSRPLLDNLGAPVPSHLRGRVLITPVRAGEFHARSRARKPSGLLFGGHLVCRSCLRREVDLGPCPSPRSRRSCCLHAPMAARLYAAGRVRRSPQRLVLDPCGAGTHFHGDYRAFSCKTRNVSQEPRTIRCRIEGMLTARNLQKNHSKKPIKSTKWPARRKPVSARAESLNYEYRHACHSREARHELCILQNNEGRSSQLQAGRHRF